MDDLTSRAEALLDLAGQWIERAEARPPPLVTDDARLDARARFERALAIVRRVARCEYVYDDEGIRLPSWEVDGDPRVAAIEEIRKFAKVAEPDLDARTRTKAAEYDAGLQLLADYMATLPKAPGVAIRQTSHRGALSRAERARTYDRGMLDRACAMATDARRQINTTQDLKERQRIQLAIEDAILC